MTFTVSGANGMGSTGGGISIAESAEGPGNVGVGSGLEVGEGVGVFVGAGVEVAVGVGVNVKVGVAEGGLGDSKLVFVGAHAARTKLAIARMRKYFTRFIFSLFNVSTCFEA